MLSGNPGISQGALGQGGSWAWGSDLKQGLSTKERVPRKYSPPFFSTHLLHCSASRQTSISAFHKIAFTSSKLEY